MSHEDAPCAHTNRLATSTSPYLRQHATNPVDWYEWGPEALTRAKTEDKPILLSVGYSACHWCHVMAHESFEDLATAKLLNDRFISVKVDREERPDIDAIYQKVVQLMGQGGGWPLTVFLTPDQKPFFGGTYFPKSSSYGRPSFTEVLSAIDDLYNNKRQDVERQTDAFMRGLTAIAAAVDADAAKAAPSPGGSDALAFAARALTSRIDPEWGGFGRAPKFPNTTALELLLRSARGEGPLADDAGAALRKTLEKMWRGGIYDHLRGGFARYSVDRVWLVPHFEKMLYDNAQLIAMYAEASVIWPDDAHLDRVVRETIDYLVADMRTEQGVFFAATDADSEGEEGKYFCWTPDEIGEVLGDDALAATFATVYSVSQDGNFEHGRSILNLPRTPSQRAADLDLSLEALEDRLAPARAKLLVHRYQRVAPLRDDKVLTSWNALLISGLARAASAIEARGEPETAAQWKALGTVMAEHLLEHHVAPDGSVFRAAFEGRVHTRGYLDDVAFLGRALLDLHEATLDPELVPAARALAQRIVEHHARPSADGFYFTADDAEHLIERSESQHDSAIPSGAGVAIELLLRLDALGHGIEGGRGLAEATLDRFRGAVEQPFAYASVLSAAMFAGSDATHVTVRGPARDSDGVAELARVARRTRLGSAHAVTLSFEAAAGPVSAIVCRGQVCTVPLSGVSALEDALESGNGSGSGNGNGAGGAFPAPLR